MANELIGTGTDIKGVKDIKAVYIKGLNVSASIIAYNVLSSSETLLSNKVSEDWVLLPPPTGGWTLEKVQGLTVQFQKGSYATSAFYMKLKVFGTLQSGNPGAFFAFF